MKKRKTCVFGFTVSQRDLALLWLEEMEEQGWALDALLEVGGGRAVFLPREGARNRYCVDIADNFYKNIERQRAYTALCRDAGWEYIGTANKIDVYRALPGRNPAPIQTDKALERRRYWREAVPSTVVTAVLGAALVLPIFWLLFSQPLRLVTLFRRDYVWIPTLVLFLALVVGMAGSLWLWVPYLRARRTRKAATPEQMHRVRRRAALTRATAIISLCCHLVFQLGNFVTVVHIPSGELSRTALLTWEDLGEAGMPASGEEENALLLFRAYVHQFTETDTPVRILRVDQYHCRYTWLAESACNLFLDQKPGLVPVELGFDEAYTHQEGDTYTLVLRQGSRAVRLVGPAELLSRPVLDLLFERLTQEVTT